METISCPSSAQATVDKTETLRQILTAEQGTPVSYEQALEIGESLIDFFKVLVEDE